MSRFRRRLILAAAGISMMLALMLFPLWIRGFFVCDCLFWTGQVSAHPQYRQQSSAVAWLERGMISIRWDRVRNFRNFARHIRRIHLHPWLPPFHSTSAGPLGRQHRHISLGHSPHHRQ